MTKTYGSLFVLAICSFLGGFLAQFFVNQSDVAAQQQGFGEEINTREINLIGDDGKVRASFYLGIHGTPQMVFFDAKGINRWNVGLAPAGNAGMTFNNEGFEPLLELDTKFDKPSISIWEEKQKREL